MQQDNRHRGGFNKLVFIPQETGLEAHKNPPLKNISKSLPQNSAKQNECQVCHGAKFVYPAVPVDDPRWGKVVLCPCQLKEWLIRSSGMAEFPRQLLADLKPRVKGKGLQPAIQAAKQILGQKLVFLTLVGDVGLAKSHILQAIGWEWIEDGRVCHYVEAARLLDNLQSSYNVTPVEVRSSEDTPFMRKLNYYCKVPLLLLDDLGVQKQTEWRQEQMDVIVNNRYDRKLPLVVSTNIPFSQMSKRVSDRLQDRRIGKVIILTGPSYRSAADES